MSLGFRERRKKVEKVFPRELEGLAIKIDQDQSMETVKVMAGADLGSTNTRIVIGTKDFLPEESNKECELSYVFLPSQFKYIDEINTDKIDPRDNSNQVYEHLDTCISFAPRKDKNDIDDSNSLVKKMRVVRGGKYSLVNYIESDILTEQSKIESLNYHTNLIDGLAWATVISYQRAGLRIPRAIEVCVGISLRPDENKSIYIEQLKKNLMHKYTWKANDLGIEMDITILDITNSTEPGALNRKFFDEFGRPVVVLNAMGGGSNSSTDIIDSNGMSVENGSRQYKICGTFLDALLQREYTTDRARLGLPPQTLTRAELDRLIMNGVIEESGRILNKESLVRNVKKVIGNQLATEILRDVFSNSNTSLKSMNTIILSGNLFKRSKFGDHDYDTQLEDLLENLAELREEKAELIANGGSTTAVDAKIEDAVKKAVELEKLVKEFHPSIADAVVDKFKEVAPNVQKILVKENLIPIGNLYNVMDAFPEFTDEILDEYDRLHPQEDEEEVEGLSLEEVKKEESFPESIDTSLDVDDSSLFADEEGILQGLENL